MSERKLRELANHWGNCRLGHGGEPCTCGLVEALADAPDLVWLLRWVRHQENHTHTEVAETWRRKAAFGDVAGAIEAQFHVRLTDDGGYEYTE